MLKLDDPKWKELTGGQRGQVDLSPLLSALEEAKEPTESWNDLWDAIYDQGRIGDGAFAAVPHVVRIHLLHGVVNWNSYALLAAIELARGQHGNPDVPEWAQPAYNDALKEMATQGLAELPLSRKPETTRTILGLVAIVFGARTYGRVLLEFTEDALLDLEKGASGDSRENALRDQLIQVVETYIDAVRRNDAAALPLHPDAICEFPTSTYRGLEAFRQGLDQFARMVKRIDVLRLVVDGEHCVALLNIDTVVGMIPFAEHIHVRDGQIVSIRGYCDPRPMLATTKPTE